VRIIGVLLLGFVMLLGCAKPVQTARPVVLAGDTNEVAGDCFPNSFRGDLVVDDQYGTALDTGSGRPVPLVWWTGVTGRRMGSEIGVFYPDGKLIAVTGNRYDLPGGAIGPNLEGWIGDPLPGGVQVYWVCAGGGGTFAPLEE